VELQQGLLGGDSSASPDSFLCHKAFPLHARVFDLEERPH